MQVSLYKDTFSTEYENVFAVNVMEGILKGKWRQEIDHLRSLDEQQYKAQKSKLPAVTWSGTFSERLDDHLVQYSKLMVLDIDNIDDRMIQHLKAQFLNDEYVKCAFVSPSMKGIKIIIEINTGPEHHLAAFLHLQKVFEEKYCLKVDKSGKNISRLCYVSYDPELVFRTHPKIFEVDIKYGEITKSYTENDAYKNAATSTDMNKIFTTLTGWVERSWQYVSGQRNNYVHAMACALNRIGVHMETAMQVCLNNYNDLEHKEVVHCVKSAYFHNSHEHGAVKFIDTSSITEYKAPPYVANYTEDVVINDIMRTTALLFHHKVPKNEIGRIVANQAKYYKLAGYIDIDRATLGDIMNKSLQVLNQNIAHQAGQSALQYVTAEELGAEFIDIDLEQRAIPTTFPWIDDNIRGGLLPGSFYGIIGVGGTFKSVIAEYISYATALNGKAVLYLNGEMSKFQFYERLSLMTMEIDLHQEIKNKNLNRGNLGTYIQQMEAVLHKNLFFVPGNGFNYENVISTIAHIEATHGKRVELVVVDGVTQMDPKGLQEIPAAIMNTAVCKRIANDANNGEGVVVLGLMHVSGDANKIVRDNGPRCRGGNKTTANMDGYFSTSLLIDPKAPAPMENQEPTYIGNKFWLKLVDKRSKSGILDCIIQVQPTLKLNMEVCDPLQYEVKQRGR